ncbi:ubiquitin-like protein ATG12 [Oscarella lobularis]|uniref:ubiquitin-like protein ATG12 n=1 Tax=Oscarella lobularis TaxID=121494 RepID=UPI0033133B86
MSESLLATSPSQADGSDEPSSDSPKVTVLLRPAADAPILKQKKYNVNRDKTAAWICSFLQRRIQCRQDEQVYLYVAQSFVPTPDQTVGNMYECFGSDGKLVLHYCKSQAWG